MTDEIKYYKEKEYPLKWVPAEEMEETPQQTIARLEQERDELKRACDKCKLFDIEKTNRDLLERIDELEQENKDLKKQIESDKGLITVGGKQQYEYLQRIDELEQENKELKEEIIELSEEKGHLIVENNTLKESNQSLSMLGTDLVSANETVRKEFFRADKNKDMWRETAEKYRSALEEIREIAEFNQFYNPEDLLINGDIGQIQDLKMTEIYNKINEVLNEK